MTLKHLKIFICVAKHENITRAAEELFMTQPAVSLAILQLEEKYNIKLFERIKQRIKITEEGKELLQYANSIINNFDDFEALAINKSSNKQIKMGSSLSVGEKLLPRLLKDFDNKKNISFTIDTSNNIINDILNSKLDLGMVETPNIDPKLEVIPITNDNLIFVCKNDYNIETEIDIKSLIKYPLLVRNKDTGVRRAFDNLINSCNLIIKPVLESTSNTSLIEFARNGFGIAVLPNIISDDLGEDLKIINLKNLKASRPISLVYKKNKVLDDREEVLIKYIKDKLKNFNL